MQNMRPSKILERDLVTKVVVQIVKGHTFLTVQDRHGAVLASAKWAKKLTYTEATIWCRTESVMVGDWLIVREGVLVTEARKAAKN